MPEFIKLGQNNLTLFRSFVQIKATKPLEVSNIYSIWSQKRIIHYSGRGYVRYLNLIKELTPPDYRQPCNALRRRQEGVFPRTSQSAH